VDDGDALREEGRRRSRPMTTPLQVGQTVPDFVLDAYDPTTKDFAKFDLAKQKGAGRWTILFFYPADWTFV
jgi:NADH-dependent peroxiredoxin subunit C